MARSAELDSVAQALVALDDAVVTGDKWVVDGSANVEAKTVEEVERSTASSALGEEWLERGRATAKLGCH